MNAKYLIIDTEATGLNAWRNGIIQLAWVIMDSQLEILEQKVIDILPPEGYAISDGALEINGFTIERIQAGCSYDEACDIFTQSIRMNFGEIKPICVGQFLPFDFKMIEMMYSTIDRAVEFEAIISNAIIDTKSTVLALNLKAELENKEIPFPITSLSKPGGLKEKFNLSFESHDALGDCLGTRLVLIEILKYLK
jgi:DNA polymerase III alpha subunit (gram-positive type)